jgi:replicative DNA helicase
MSLEKFEASMREIDAIPDCINAEKLVISSLLCDKYGETFDFCSKLKPFHFLLRSHAIIFETILKLRGESKGTDLVVVSNELQTSGKILDVGGHGELSKLFSSSGFASHTQDHIDLIIEKYRLRKIIEICESIKSKASNSSTSSECLSGLEHDVFDLQDNDNSNENQLQSACDELDKLIEIRRKGEQITGLITGVRPFDEIFFGFQPSQYYVLGGMPSSGKTAMADQICGQLLMRDKAVLYISLESNKERVIGKLACKLAEVSYLSFIRNHLSKDELEEVQKFSAILRKKNLILIRPFDISPMEIRPLIRKYKRKENIQLVILDYLQKISIPSGWDERRTVSRASTEIQRACVDTGVPSLILCQLNREVGEGSRPSMRNLKESSQIEQDADNVALIWGEVNKRDLPSTDRFWPCTLSVDKNKDGASGLDVDMDFELRKMIFHKRK